MKLHSQRFLRTGAPVAASQAFSVLEVMIIIAIMGVMVTLALTFVGRTPIAVRDTKLSSDVATLNQMVAVYVSDGGSLAGLTDAKAVVDKLKRSRPQTEWQRHTGPVSGRLVDPRLAARVSNQPSQNGQQRAKWNTKTQRFEMITTSGAAVEEFYIDETKATADYGTESRAVPTVKYNSNASGKNQGWVWGNSLSSNFAYASPGTNSGDGLTLPFNPDELLPTPPPEGGGGGGSGGGGGGGGESGGGGGGTTPPAATKLPTPKITPGGGTYAYSAFPGNASISANGAPSGGSLLEYRINGGAWTPYSSASPVIISPADNVQARNRALDTVTYKNSNTTAANFYRLTSGFTGSGSGSFSNGTGGPNLLTDVDNGSESSTFKHGNTKLDLGNGQVLDAGVENVLTFTKDDFESIIPNTWFNLGQLLLLNGTTFYNSEADAVTLSINLDLTQPAQSAVIHIDLGLISTENSTDRLASADIVELRNPTTDLRITIDGVEYRLELSWATLDPGAGVVQGNQFLIFEGASANAALRGRFVSNH